MSKTIEDLRTVLFETIEGVKSGKLDLDRAKMVSDLSQVVVNSAKVEVEFIRTVEGKNSRFLGGEEVKDLPSGITGVHVHKIK